MQWPKRIPTLTLISVALLFSSSCSDSVSQVTGATETEAATPTEPTPSGAGSSSLTLIHPGANKCTAQQNSTVTSDRATLDCDINFDQTASAFSGTCTLSNYTCSGTGVISGGSFGQDASCEFDVDYPNARITYTCDPTRLDLVNQAMGLNYTVNDASSACSQDSGTVDAFNCTAQ